MRYRDPEARGERLPLKPLLEKGCEIRYLPERFFDITDPFCFLHLSLPKVDETRQPHPF